MNSRDLEKLMSRIGATVIEVYAGYVQQGVPKVFVVAAMAGSLAACAVEAEVPEERLIASIKSATDDIKKKDG